MLISTNFGLCFFCFYLEKVFIFCISVHFFIMYLGLVLFFTLCHHKELLQLAIFIATYTFHAIFVSTRVAWYMFKCPEMIMFFFFFFFLQKTVE